MAFELTDPTPRFLDEIKVLIIVEGPGYRLLIFKQQLTLELFKLR